MNLYKSVGYTVGTPEALALSERLSEWHDSMVAHQRPADTSRVTRCDGDCPHTEAQLLWREAVEAFGDHAEKLGFLRRHGFQAILGANGHTEDAVSRVAGFSPRRRGDSVPRAARGDSERRGVGVAAQGAH